MSKCKKTDKPEKSWWASLPSAGKGGTLTQEMMQNVANKISGMADKALTIPTNPIYGAVQLTAEQMKSAGNKPGGSGLKALYDQEIQNLKEDVQTLSFKGKPFTANAYTTTHTITNPGNTCWPSATAEGYTTTFPDVGFTTPPSPKQPQTMEELYKGTSFDSDVNKPPNSKKEKQTI